jgi:putative endopeptidase
MKQTLTPVIILVTSSLALADGFPKREFKVNESVNPCENFYEYACSATIKSFELPKTRSRHSFSFDDTRENLLSYKKNYFKSLATSKATSDREKQIQSFYVSCMNETANQDAELRFVAQLQKQLDGVKTREQFSELIYENLKVGDPSFLTFWANLPNFKDSQRMDVYFEIATLTLPEQSYYSKEDVTKDLKALIVKFFESVKADNPGEKAQWVYDFEMGLAKVFPTGVQINKKVFSLTEHSKTLSKKLKNLRLGQFIRELPGKPHVRNLFGDEPFEYIDHSMSQLPLEQLKAIHLYFAARNFLDDAYPEFRTQSIDFLAKHLGGPSERPERQERCTNEIEQKFAMELDSILMPKLFANFPKERVHGMVEQIKAGLIAAIEKNTWLSSSSRKSALLKLKHLNIRLVSPDTEQEWNFNKSGGYSATAPVDNRLLYGRLKQQKYFENLTQRFPNPVWQFGPLEMNAALLPPYNAIIFPVAFLQPPFFDVDAPEEVNMAAIGTVIGHELGHAIDDKGYTFDYKGRVNPWLKKADEEKFFALSKSLVDQFNRAGMEGKFTLGENIGDLVGLTNAYSSAFPNGSNKPLSLKKEFFTQYARMWCEVQKPEIAELRRKVDPHAFGVARTNEQVKQQPGFAEAFGCKSTDPMVLPKQQVVRIW